MRNIKILAEQLKIVPKLRLGIKKVGGGVDPTGSHHVKFIEEPVSVLGRDDKGQPRKELKFIVEENGQKYRWMVPILGKDGQPSYLIERLMDVEVGDERILEMVRERGRNYIDIRRIDEESEAPEDEEKVIQMDEEDDLSGTK